MVCISTEVTIIEDDTVMSDKFRTIIKDRFNIDCQVVNNREDALKLILPGKKLILILDIRLPINSANTSGALYEEDPEAGLKIIEKINNVYSLAQVIVVTCHLDTEGAVEMMKLGASDVIIKGGDYEVMRDRLFKAIEKCSVEADKDIIFNGVVESVDEDNSIISFSSENGEFKRIFETSLLQDLHIDHEGDSVRLVTQYRGNKIITQLVPFSKDYYNEKLNDKLKGLKPLTPEERKKGYIEPEDYDMSKI